MMRVERSLGNKEPEEKTLLSELRRVWWPVLRDLLKNFNGLQVSSEFTSADVVSDTLTYVHNLESEIVAVTVIDEDGIIRGDLLADMLVLVYDRNTVVVDLTGVTVEGTWKIMVRRD